jgi:hypothetical protein
MGRGAVRFFCMEEQLITRVEGPNSSAPRLGRMGALQKSDVHTMGSRSPKEDLRADSAKMLPLEGP